MRIEKSFVELAHIAADVPFDREDYARKNATLIAASTVKRNSKPWGSNSDRRAGALFAQERVNAQTFAPVMLTDHGIVGVGPQGVRIVNWFAGVVERVA